MLFVDLLRLTVLLIGGAASILGLLTAVAANQDVSYSVVYISAGWWVIAAVLGIFLGTPGRAAGAMSRPLAGARTATSLPTESAGRIAFQRLWPIGAFVIIAGGLSFIW